MADYKLIGDENLPPSSEIGVITEGIGFALRPVEPGVAGVGMQTSPGSQYSVAIGNTWVNALNIAGNPTFFYVEAGIPGPGQVQLNNADISLATSVTISQASSSGADGEAVFEKLDSGSVISIVDWLDNSNYLIADITGPSVDVGSSFTIPINVRASNGSFGDTVPLQISIAAFQQPSYRVDREIVIRGSDYTDQNPSGLDNPHQVTFGPAMGTGADPVNINADGSIDINEAANYHFRISLQYGRTGGGGTGWLWFRFLVNGVQAGISVLAKLENSNDHVPYQAEITADLPQGAVVTGEVWRGSEGNNSGGLLSETPALPGASPSPSADIIVSRYVIQESP